MECVRALIHPIPSDVDSLLIVQISYDQRNKNVGNSVFDLFRIEGNPNRLAPHNVYLRKLWRTISPRVCCYHHQNPKAEDALTVALSQIRCQLHDHPKQYDNDDACHNNGTVENCMAIYLGMAMEMP